MDEYESESVIHTFFCCLSSGRSQRLLFYLHLGIFAPALVSCFLSVISVSLCPKIQLSVYVLPSVSALPSHCLCSHLTRLHLDTDLHISLPPTSFHSLQCIYCPQSDSSWKWAVSISQTLPVVWKEGCFSFRSLTLLLSFSRRGGRRPAFLYLFPLGAPGSLMMQISKQTKIHKCRCRNSETYMC